MKRIRTTIYVDENVYKEFKLLCVMSGRSISDIINNFIKSQVEKNGKGEK